MQNMPYLQSAYAEAGKFQHAFRVLRNMNTLYKMKPSTSSFNKVLKAASKEGEGNGSYSKVLHQGFHAPYFYIVLF